MLKIAKKQALLSKAKNVGGAFVIKGSVTPGGKGMFYGTFGGKVEHFEPVAKQKKPYEHEKKNFYTSPAKKGNCGYVNITIGKLPGYESSPFSAALDADIKHNQVRLFNFSATILQTYHTSFC